MSMTREEWQAVEDRVGARVGALYAKGDYTVSDRVDELVAKQPDAPALVYGDRRYTYAQLNDAANCYAALALPYGLRAGDVASMMIENRPEFLFAWLGLLKIGVKPALINTETKQAAVTHAVSTVDSKLVLVGAECWSKYASGDALFEKFPTVVIADEESGAVELPDGVAEFDDDIAVVAPEKFRELRAGLGLADTCCYIFTSGTTGLPKAAYITHGKFLSAGEIATQRASIGPEDVFYCVLPLFHGAALMSLYSTVLACGASLVVRRKFSASAFWKDVSTYGVTVFQYVGEVCRYLVNSAPVAEEKNHSLRVMFGAGMGPDVWRQFVKRFGEDIHILEGWGSTESNCSLMNLDNTPGACGRIPFKDKSIVRLIKYDLENDEYIYDSQGFHLECGVDEAGEVIGCVHRADGVFVSPFDGYTNKDESNKKLLFDVFEKGDCWFRSGDLLKHDAQDYYYFYDRMGDTFRWKSENVSTTEVAQQLTACGDTEMINVYGVKVPGCEGRAGMAAVVMKEGKIFDPQRFYRCAVATLAPYAVPLFVRVSGEAQVTANFKLKKVDLRSQGYDPSRFEDDLYVLDHRAQSYLPYSEQLLAELDIRPFSDE